MSQKRAQTSQIYNFSHLGDKWAVLLLLPCASHRAVLRKRQKVGGHEKCIRTYAEPTAYAAERGPERVRERERHTKCVYRNITGSS